MHIDTIKVRIQKALQVGSELRAQLFATHAGTISAVADALAECFRNRHKVLIFGNGGSAADAQHMASELVGRYRNDRIALPVIALTTDSSVLTSVSNDYGYEEVFSRQIEALGCCGDIAIAISTSGKSPNVLRGIDTARAKGMRVVGLTGAAGIGTRLDWEIGIPSSDTARVQELHITTIHLICEIAEDILITQRGSCHLFAARKIVDWKRVLEIRKEWKKENKSVVWTNGCFDLLHAGHLRAVEIAKSFGDVLVVGVNSDDAVRQLKGPDRPIMNLRERMELLAGMECVDIVTPLDSVTPQCAISELKPDVHCRSSRYAPPNGKPIPELRTVLEYGGSVKFIDLIPGISTREVLNRVQQRAKNERQ